VSNGHHTTPASPTVHSFKTAVAPVNRVSDISSVIALAKSENRSKQTAADETPENANSLISCELREPIVWRGITGLRGYDTACGPDPT
jgi:hypothetical protein